MANAFNGSVIDQGGITGSSITGYPGDSTSLILVHGVYQVEIILLLYICIFYDGICCSYGSGSYSLTTEDDGTVLASGGSFGFSESTDFTIN